MTPAPDLDDAPTAARTAAGRALAVGTRLRDYEISGVVGQSRFGIVYLAWDHALQRKVAVREYMPASMASRASGSAAVVVRSERDRDAFKAGLKGFVDEARLLARFDHPSLVKVYRFWEENGTACMAMPFYEGPTLTKALAELGHVPSESELRAWLKPVLDAVAVLHDGRTWHQNIGPDEIVLTPMGPVLLGFGAAGHAVETIRGTPGAALKPGFAALEQYGREAGLAIGPWTDLYGLAAVVHAAIAGVEPLEAPARATADSVQPLTQVAAGLYSPGFLAAIDAALALQPAARPRDHVAFRALMGGIEATPSVSLAPPSDLMQELFLGDAGSHREVTVPDRPLLAPAAPPAAVAASPAPHDPPAGRRPPKNSRHGDDSVPAGTAARIRPVTRQSAGSLGRRALYGIVAATCACIGVAALGLQFYLRPPVRSAAAAAPAAAAATAPDAISARVPAAPPVAPAAATDAAPAFAAVAAATLATTAAASAAAPAAASGPVAAKPTPAYSTGPDPLGGRQARCVDILQKASLERISPADTEFFKKECK